MQISSGRANRCVRSPDNPAPPGDNDWKAEQRAAQTFAMRKAVHAATQSLGHSSGRPLYKISRARLSGWCDKKSGVPRVPFLDFEPEAEMPRVSDRAL